MLSVFFEEIFYHMFSAICAYITGSSRTRSVKFYKDKFFFTYLLHGRWYGNTKQDLKEKLR